MGDITQLPFPVDQGDQVEHDLIEIDAAIALVAGGFARRVCLVGLRSPELAAAIGLAHAQDRGVTFSLDHGVNGSAVVTVGAPTAHV
jgi:hypothetical protein